MTPYDHIAHEDTVNRTDKAAGQKNAAPAHPSNVKDAQHVAFIRKTGIAVGTVLGLLLVVGLARHYFDHRAAMSEMETRLHAIPAVRVEVVKPSKSARDLSLPGNTSAFESATIYARQSGYVAQRLVDIGSKVKTGDLLAVLTAPEIDDQLNQARAQLNQMEAALKQAGATRSLAQATDKRTAELVKNGWQSQQQGDTDRLNLQAQSAAVDVARANLAAQQAQVARLEKEQAYERVIAPFDGVITQRSVDTGSLVTADSASGTPMFSIARTNVLRVQVYVPQDAAIGVKEGIGAIVRVPEIVGREFHGRVARTAEALQAGTRTLLTEIDIDNPDDALAAGVYCTVTLELPRTNPVIVVPADALIVNSNGTQVAVLEDGKAHIRKVVIADDDGARVSIADGLKEDDKVIVGLPVDLEDGAPVTIRPAPNAPAKPL
jgi:RND family efflux transporter MFP subunit